MSPGCHKPLLGTFLGHAGLLLWVAVCLQCLRCRLSAGLLYSMRLFSDLLLPRVGCQPGPAFMQLLASEFAALQIDWHFRTYCVAKRSRNFPYRSLFFYVPQVVFRTVLLKHLLEHDHSGDRNSFGLRGKPRLCANMHMPIYVYLVPTMHVPGDNPRRYLRNGTTHRDAE